MWAFAGHKDRMRLQEEDLAPEVLRTVLRVLTGDPSPGSLRHDAALLYLCSGRADFLRQMPSLTSGGCVRLASRDPARTQLLWLLFRSPTAVLPQAMERRDENRRELRGPMSRC